MEDGFRGSIKMEDTWFITYVEHGLPRSYTNTSVWSFRGHAGQEYLSLDKLPTTFLSYVARELQPSFGIREHISSIVPFSTELLSYYPSIQNVSRKVNLQ